MIKTLNKLGIEETYLNIIKAICDKPIVNATLSGEMADSFSTEPRMLSLTTFINIKQEIVAKAISQEKE